MRPRRAIPVLLTLGIGLWCCGCASEGAGCWTALGDPVQDTVHLDTDDWDRLLVLDRVEVDWWPGDSVPFAVLHAHTGTVEGLRVTPEEDALRIENVNRCAWVRPLDAWPRVELHGVAPPRVELESQADFHMKAPWVGPRRGRAETQFVRWGRQGPRRHTEPIRHGQERLLRRVHRLAP